MHKGFFSFNINSEHGNSATLVVTHPQQSEECAFPAQAEIDARAKSIALIIEHMEKSAEPDKALILAGDLNLDDQEFDTSDWKLFFDERARFPRKTWGGDEFCANLVGKQISPALNYDYMLAAKGTVGSMNVSLVDTGYDPKMFLKQALSDHEGLFGTIVLK